MKIKLMAALSMFLITAPLVAGTAHAAKNGTCKVVYYGSAGPVCEPESGPSTGKH